MGHHVGVFEQRIETAAVERDGRNDFKRIGQETDDAKKKRRDDGKNHHHPGHHFMVAITIDPGDDAGEDDENPFPKQKRAFERAPKSGDAVVYRRGAGGVESDVLNREISGDQTIDQRHRRHRDQRKLTEDRVARDGAKAFRFKARRDQRTGDAGQRRDKGQQDRSMTESCGHLATASLAGTKLLLGVLPSA